MSRRPLPFPAELNVGHCGVVELDARHVHAER
jgi:hypothetical protein